MFTQAPLNFSDREKKPAQPARKRRKQSPKTPALTFDPLQRMIPSGRQDSPVQTPASYQEQPTPISATNEFPDFIDEVDDCLASGITAPSHSTTSKRPRAQSGSDESLQTPSYPVPYSNLRFEDHYESPSSGGSSSSPATSYGSSPHPQYNEHQYFHPELMGPYCPIDTDYPHIRRVTADVYEAPRDTGYHPPQGDAWYCPSYPANAYRDSF